MTNDVQQDECAIALVLALEARGFTIMLEHGHVVVTPGSRLTALEAGKIEQHLDALRLLVGCGEAGVLERRAVLEQTLKRGVRLLQFCDDIRVDDRAICYSCGDRLAVPRGGRCWRCQLACRLACGAPIPADLALAWTEAEVVASAGAL